MNSLSFLTCFQLVFSSSATLATRSSPPSSMMVFPSMTRPCLRPLARAATLFPCRFEPGGFSIMWVLTTWAVYFQRGRRVPGSSLCPRPFSGYGDAPTGTVRLLGTLVRGCFAGSLALFGGGADLCFPLLAQSLLPHVFGGSVASASSPLCPAGTSASSSLLPAGASAASFSFLCFPLFNSFTRIECPLKSVPLSFSMASLVASSVENSTNPQPRAHPFLAVPTLTLTTSPTGLM
mmetsp:Transcript_59427/g.126348  ORF Transcript_59427/g.126348 Transcript_59427/m.126348 type:complete len:235 (-) Transcript_59427:1836-2540(-)